MSFLSLLKKVFEPREEWRLEGEAEKYYSAKLLSEIIEAKGSLDEARQDLPGLDIEFIIKRLRNALKLDKQVISLARGMLVKRSSRENMKILEDTEKIFKTIRNILAFFIRLERFENRGGNIRQKVADLQWASQELQKVIETARILLEEEKSKE